MTQIISHFRRAGATTAFAVMTAVGAVACNSNDAFSPSSDIGIPSSGVLRGAVEAGQIDRSVGFAAGRSGPAIVNVCGPLNSSYRVDLVAGRDTVATRSASSGCVNFAFRAQQGLTYRLNVRAGAQRGEYTACYVIGDSTCVAPTPTAAIPGVPLAYYTSAEGKTGQELITALFEIIKGQELFSYLNARDSMYAVVDDPDNDDIIIDQYNGRAARVNSRATADSASFNAEHTWPQSRGAGEPPAESDLHNLFTTDGGSNSRRSNYPFGKVVDTVSTSLTADADGQRSVLGTNAQGVLVFEPRDSKKGDVARAIFYFYTRYKLAPTPSFTLANFNIEEPVLRQWAQQDPPDDFERARSNLVFRVQGNRNPFIDRPEFLTAIGDFPNQ